MTQVSRVLLPYTKGPYSPDEVGKRDPHGATFVTEAAGKTKPGLFANVRGIYPFLNGMFGHEARGELQVHLGQRAGPCALPAFHAVEDLKFFYYLVQRVHVVHYPSPSGPLPPGEGELERPLDFSVPLDLGGSELAPYLIRGWG
jgi:hypothetical protein